MRFNIEAVLSANPLRFVTGLATAGAASRGFAAGVERDAKRATTALDGISGSMTRLAAGVALTAAGISLGLGLSRVTNDAAEFEVSLRNINTIAHLTDQELGALGDTILDLSSDVPQTANVLARGFYNIQSSGFAGAEAMDILEQSAIAASAGLTTTDVSARAVAATMNAYGDAVGDATDITDVLFQTVNLGVITFEELADNLGDWIGSASAAGIAFDEASAALATMTLSGIQATEAATSLNRVLISFIDPSEAMSAALANIGFESGVAALQARGLQGVMEDLSRAGFDTVESLNELFPEIRGLRGATALIAQDGANFRRVAAGITDESERAGAAQRAFEEQTKALNTQIQLLKNALMEAGIQLGQTFLPVINAIIQPIIAVVGFFNDLPAPVHTAIAVIAGLSAVLMTVAGVMLLFSLRGLAIRRAMDLVTASMSPGRAAMMRRFFSGPITQARTLGTALTGLRARADGTSVAMQRLGTAARIAGGALTAGLLGFSFAQTVLDNARQNAEELRTELEADIDTSSYESFRQSLIDIQEEQHRLNEQADRGGGLTGFLNEATQNLLPWEDNTIRDAKSASAEIFGLLEEQNQALIRYRNNLRSAARQTGLTVPQVEALADEVGVDMTGALHDVVPALVTAAGRTGQLANDILTAELAADRFTSQVQALGTALRGFTSTSAIMQETTSRLQDEQDALNESGTSTRQVWIDAESAAIGIIRANWELRDATEALNEALSRNIELDIMDAALRREEAILGVADAQQRVYDAELNLQRVREAGRSPRDIAQAERDLARARIEAGRAEQEVGTAEENFVDVSSGQARAREIEELNLRVREASLGVAEAQERAAEATRSAAGAMSTAAGDLAVTAADYLETLAGSLAQQEEWEGSLIDLAGRLGELGLDTAILDQLIELGPEGAQIIEDFNRMTDVEFKEAYKLMLRGARRNSEDYAREFRRGLDLVHAIARDRMTALPGIFESNLREIPSLFNATFEDVDALARAWGLNVVLVPNADLDPRFRLPPGGTVSSPRPRLDWGGAEGGVVPGPQWINRDVVPAVLMPGEFVMRKAAVQRVGVNTLHQINRAPTRFASGGEVTPWGARARSAMGGVTVIQVPIPERLVHQTFVEARVLQNMDEVIRDSRMIQRRERLTSGG